MTTLLMLSWEEQNRATDPMNGIIQSELMDLIYESAETKTPARPKR